MQVSHPKAGSLKRGIWGLYRSYIGLFRVEGLPKLGVFFGRFLVLVCCGLYWGPLILGNCHTYGGMLTVGVSKVMHDEIGLYNRDVFGPKSSYYLCRA